MSKHILIQFRHFLTCILKKKSNLTFCEMPNIIIIIIIYSKNAITESNYIAQQSTGAVEPDYWVRPASLFSSSLCLTFNLFCATCAISSCLSALFSNMSFQFLSCVLLVCSTIQFRKCSMCPSCILHAIQALSWYFHSFHTLMFRVCDLIAKMIFVI